MVSIMLDNNVVLTYDSEAGLAIGNRAWRERGRIFAEPRPMLNPAAKWRYNLGEHLFGAPVPAVAVQDQIAAVAAASVNQTHGEVDFRLRPSQTGDTG